MEFTGAPAFGVAEGSEGLNPFTSDFALGVTFTSEPLAGRTHYTGNVAQKGPANAEGQVKTFLAPRSGGR